MIHMPRLVAAIVLILSGYAVLKFLFFFVVPYRKRRALLDKAYAGKAYATAASDRVLLVLAVGVAAIVLGGGGEPIAFLGGIFVGATLIQLFFHAFHAPVPPNREAPEPVSPLKRMSYAIQDRPALAWKVMAIYALIVAVGVGLDVIR